MTVVNEAAVNVKAGRIGSHAGQFFFFGLFLAFFNRFLIRTPASGLESSLFFLVVLFFVAFLTTAPAAVFFGVRFFTSGFSGGETPAS